MHYASHPHRRTKFAAALLCALVTMVAAPSFASARHFDVSPPAPAPAIDAGSPVQAPAPATATVREPSGYALSIALASAALLVAIVGSGYVAIRLRGPHQRTIES